jgi:hypothetical protein
MEQIQELLVSIVTDGDDKELDTLRMDLAEELSLLPINAVESVSRGEVPPNARGLDVVAIGELLIKLGPDTIKTVVHTIRSWLQRSFAGSVELKIDGDSITLSKASVADQERLLDMFVARHQST